MNTSINDKRQCVLTDEQVELVKKYTRLHKGDLEDMPEKMKINKLMLHVESYPILVSDDEEDRDALRRFIRGQADKLGIPYDAAASLYMEEIREYTGELILNIYTTAEEAASYCTFKGFTGEEAASSGLIDLHYCARAEIRQIIVEQLMVKKNA